MRSICALGLKAVADLLVAANDGVGGYEVKSFPADRKRIDIGDYYADDSAIRAALRWEPRVALADGLRRTVEFYRDHLSEYL
jgi:UDP-glucose 4-epimerase